MLELCIGTSSARFTLFLDPNQELHGKGAFDAATHFVMLDCFVYLRGT